MTTMAIRRPNSAHPDCRFRTARVLSVKTRVTSFAWTLAMNKSKTTMACPPRLAIAAVFSV